MTVSGLTMTRASFQPGQRRERKTQKTRSSGESRGRGLSRFRTATCWRRAMFSSCNVARLRTISRTKAKRNMAIVCMLQTVASSAPKCQNFRSRRGFEERTPPHPARGSPFQRLSLKPLQGPFRFASRETHPGPQDHVVLPPRCLVGRARDEFLDLRQELGASGQRVQHAAPPTGRSAWKVEAACRGPNQLSRSLDPKLAREDDVRLTQDFDHGADRSSQE